jgi:hypothetical protein
LLLTLRSSPPSSCNTTVPDNPDTVPPTEYAPGDGVAALSAVDVLFVTAELFSAVADAVSIVKVLAELTAVPPAPSNCLACAV